MALAHTDAFLMLDDAVFSVIGPEAAAVILWHDSSRAEEATRALRIDARSLVGLGVCDEIVSTEPGADLVASMRTAVARALVQSVPGDRHRRVDAATARWLRR